MTHKTAQEIERLRAEVSGLKQSLSQAGDVIGLQEAEQCGYVRGRAERDELLAVVKDCRLFFAANSRPSYVKSCDAAIAKAERK